MTFIYFITPFSLPRSIPTYARFLWCGETSMPRGKPTADRGVKLEYVQKYAQVIFPYPPAKHF